MTLNEILLATAGLGGWLWAIIQYGLSRKHQRRDRLVEKRHEVYASFMSRVDEAQADMRAEMKTVLNIYPPLMATIMKGDESETNRALAEFNEHLMGWLQRAIEPLMKINQETNRMKLVCSERMMPMVDSYKRLANDYCEEFQIAMNRMSTNKDINVTAKELTNLGQNRRQEELAALWIQLVAQMRRELQV